VKVSISVSGLVAVSRSLASVRSWAGVQRYRSSDDCSVARVISKFERSIDCRAARVY
jgi:hypothetical protein